MAAIDVGTNSIRLIVAEARSDGTYRLIDDEKEAVRLGQGMAASRKLSPKVMQEAAMVIARMHQIAQGYGVDAEVAVGTCAVREAANASQFVKLVRKHAKLELRVISAEEEARLAFLSAKHFFDINSINAAVVDIGGGSTEVVMSTGGVVEDIHTLPLGAVRLTEQFQQGEQLSHQAFEAMCEHIRKVMKKGMGKPSIVPQLVIGTGGTFTTLASIAINCSRKGENEQSPPSVRGYELKRAQVNHLLSWLHSLSPKGRARVQGLSADRSDIIVAGVAIIDELMRRLKVNTLRVHDRGIRDGLIISMMMELLPGARRSAPASLDRLAAVRRFASSCNYEKPHSEHVARLAVQAFDELAQQMKDDEVLGDPNNRLLLEAAGVLHDVGYYINYAKHHKHSYHLIIHSDLPGFTHREVSIIANIARYHRKASPKQTHSNFALLDERDRRIVLKLVAILRIVDGLDRAHAQTVQGVNVQLRKGTAWFIVGAQTEPAVDMWGAARKSSLFLKAFGLEARFDWSGAKDGKGAAALLRHAVENAAD